MTISLPSLPRSILVAFALLAASCDSGTDSGEVTATPGITTAAPAASPRASAVTVPQAATATLTPAATPVAPAASVTDSDEQPAPAVSTPVPVWPDTWTVTNGGTEGAPAFTACRDATPAVRLQDGTSAARSELGGGDCRGMALVRTTSSDGIGGEFWVALRYLAGPAIDWQLPLSASWADLADTLAPDAADCVAASLSDAEMAEMAAPIFTDANAPAWSGRFLGCVPVSVAVAVGIGGVRADAERSNVALDSTACWQAYVGEIVARDHNALVVADPGPEIEALVIDGLLTCSPVQAAVMLAEGYGALPASAECFADSPADMRAAMTAPDDEALLATVALLSRCEPDLLVAQLVEVIEAETGVTVPASSRNCLAENGAAVMFFRAAVSDDAAAALTAEQLMEQCVGDLLR